jgi:hypothetical protein
MGMDGTREQPYNGWENKWTWLLHLHLSNEACLMEEITELVMQEPNDGAAGRLLEMWVKVALSNWLSLFPVREIQHDEEMRLLAWGLLGSALAYVEWVQLIELLGSGGATDADLLTMTVYRSVLGSSQLQKQVGTVLRHASSLYAGADEVKEWFEVQLDTWIEYLSARLRKQAPCSKLCRGLIQNVYGLIAWEHFASMTSSNGKP